VNTRGMLIISRSNEQLLLFTFLISLVPMEQGDFIFSPGTANHFRLSFIVMKLPRTRFYLNQSRIPFQNQNFEFK
jgi:hypothetical protein